jgi:hypothetical protein
VPITRAIDAGQRSIEHTSRRCGWPPRAADLFARLRRRHTRIAPTLVMHQVLDRPEDAPVNDARLKQD